MSISLRSRLLGVSALTICFASAHPASAQQVAPEEEAPASQAAPEQETASGEGNVVVTASRVKRDGFESPTPETVMAAETLETQANRNISQSLYELPSIAPMTSGNGGATSVGAQYVALRNLGAARTLVLINGRRVSQTNPLGGTDINVVPAALVQSVNVVTGGASATYGSDAVAGMVNLQLNTTLEGLKGDAQYGITEYGDSEEYSASLAWGTKFAEGRGHLVLAGEYTDNQGMETCEKRDWCQDNWALVLNPNYAPGNGEYRQIISPNARLASGTFGGLITTGPLKGTYFLPGGISAPFEYGTNVGTTHMIGGTDDGWTGKQREGVAPLNRHSLYGTVTYDLTDNVTFFAEASYTRTHSWYDSGQHNDLGSRGLLITRENAFLPADIAARMDAEHISSFRLGRLEPELGLDGPDSRNTNHRYVAGARGVLGDWQWESYLSYSKNRYYAQVIENRLQEQWRLAVDSILDPVTGDPICRSTLTDPGNGCVPANVFGAGAISPDVKSYVSGDSWQDAVSEQKVFALNINGEPFSLWAGPVSVATGIEYREDNLEGDSDYNSQIMNWRQVNAQPISGGYNVKEAYVEALVPLAVGLPFADNLEVNGAARYAEYSTSGGVTTWKVGLNYSPIRDIRVRLTQSRDIRAPNNNELFSSLRQNIPTLNDPFTNTTVSIPTFTGGNPLLKPEEADTFTVGVVLSPSFIPGLRASVDYFSIDLDGAITTLGAQGTIDACYNGQAPACAGIVRDPTTNGIATVYSQYFNLQELRTSGYDFELSYRTPVDRLVSSWSGDLQFRMLATYVKEFSQKDGNIVLDRAGQVVGGGVPHWRGTVNLSYDSGPVRVALTGLYVDGGVWDKTYGQYDITDNNISGRAYLNVSGRYRVLGSGDENSVDLFFKIDNLFDNDPPLTPISAFNPTPTSSPYYDKLGRRFAAGVRFRL
ncbi:TonB-dependent receptor-like protein [Hephaestia caeni]|uniref:TonB-dependent receptor-like protein n=1 Tax=Hephaestia caeni TaxID=645617 RepID=A0A397NQQ6_9SPHN|nr:TonB-dependent receptor [Hephaestia caeni]RIA37095.1 TonB-dependent receptor-like protein [Hephaestia caeni]